VIAAPGRYGLDVASNYITAEGFARLESELKQLWTVERPRVTQEVSDAAALGDRSENAEYIYGKKRLREIDRRIRYLSKRLDALTVVKPSPDQAGRVYFGALVEVEDAGGDSFEVQLVGPDESDAARGRISIDSPMGRALLGRREGDEFSFERPRGRTELCVVGIRYELEG